MKKYLVIFLLISFSCLHAKTDAGLEKQQIMKNHKEAVCQTVDILGSTAQRIKDHKTLPAAFAVCYIAACAQLKFSKEDTFKLIEEVYKCAHDEKQNRQQKHEGL